MSSIKNIKKDLKEFSDQDISLLYKYYEVNNIDALIAKIYPRLSFHSKKSFLPSGIMEAIEKQDFEEFKKICDSIATDSSSMVFNSGVNDPDEAYEIFDKVEESKLDPETKLKWIEYLFDFSWPRDKSKISLDGNKIKINPEMNLNIITSLRKSGSPRHLTNDEFQSIFNRILDRLRYENEKYEMLDLIVRYASKMWGGIVKDPVADIKKLIARYPDIDLYKPYKWHRDQETTLFEISIKLHVTSVIQYLIDNAPDKKSLLEPTRGPQGWGVLFATSNIDTIKTLISIGADVNSTDHGEPYLVYIIEDRSGFYGRNTKEIIKMLYDTGKLDLEKEDTEGQTALNVAASHGEPDVFSYLIELGANINHQTHEGVTPLMITAAYSRHDPQGENFKTLMKYKDRSNFTSGQILDLDSAQAPNRSIPSRGRNLDFNLQTKYMKSTALLACQGYPHSTFINPHPTLEAELELIKYTNLNIQNKDGNTILHLAFDNRIVSACLGKGAKLDFDQRSNSIGSAQAPNLNLDILNNKGETPLSINIQGFKNTLPIPEEPYSKKAKQSHEIYNKNVINLINHDASLNNIEIQDLLPFYDIVIPNLENRLNTLLNKLNKPEKKLFDEKCPKQIYFKKEIKEVEHINYLKKCIKIIEDMIKYKPGGEEETRLVKKYREHSYFSK